LDRAWRLANPGTPPAEAIDKDEGTGRWPAGTRGTVVIDLGDHKMVEISNDRGETPDMPAVPAAKLDLIAKHSR
jgi:hypothetical protein